MIRCKQSKNRKIPYAIFTLRAAGIVLLLAFCSAAVCGCAGKDKYVEIIIAANDAVVTPVPMIKDAAITGANTAGMPQTPEPTAMLPKSEAGPEEDERPKATEKPTPTPAITPTPTPTITPTPTPTPKPTPTATIRPTATPIATPTPKPTPTPVPTPDTEKLMQKELDDVYAEYVEEWEKLYAEYETKCAQVQQTLNYMGEPSEDPEYIQAKAALEAELDTYAAEFKAKEEALEAVYYGLYSAIYDKYGK